MLNKFFDTGSALIEVLFWILLPVAIMGLLVTGTLFFGSIAFFLAS